MKNQNNTTNLSPLVNSIKALSIDAVEKANSGHPGMPMGAADMASVLWNEFYQFDPQDPSWEARDRFILSAGHGSMLLYSLLHLYEFDVSLEDIRQFRQINSLTPGHPEYGHTKGVDVSTGPLGQGFANGVGMAIANFNLRARFPSAPEVIFDQTIYGIVSDGDLMEGISSEAASIAGHLKLSNLIYLYDSNSITIDGKTDLTFSEDIEQKFQALGWNVLNIDGHQHEQVRDALRACQKSLKPSLIIAQTHIGKGSPNKQDTSKAHGAPLGAEEIALFRQSIAWPEEDFYVSQEARNICKEAIEKKHEKKEQWKKALNQWEESDSKAFKRYQDFKNKASFSKISWNELLKLERKSEGSRKTNSRILQAIVKQTPNLLCGSADLAGSTNAIIANEEPLSAQNYGAQNIAYGIREHAMGAISNGLSLYGCHVPVSSTFLVFSDYMRNPLRLACMSGLQSVFVFTHDSIFVGEDGPTHQPVEHLSSLRVIPNSLVFRPSSLEENVAAWKFALENTDRSSMFCLSRQNIDVLTPANPVDLSTINQGGYVFSQAKKETFDCVIMASGSEMVNAKSLYDDLISKGKCPRLVSVPCLDLLLEQEEDFQHELVGFNHACPQIVIEAAEASSWFRLLGPQRKVFEVQDFGMSAPAKDLEEAFGFTQKHILDASLDS